MASRRRGAVLAVAAVGLVSALLALQRGSRQEPRPLPARTLLVLPVSVDDPSAEYAWLRHGLAEVLRWQLGQSPGLLVVPRHRLADELARHGLDEAREPSAEVAARIAERLGAGHLLRGSFVRSGPGFVLSASLLELPGGQAETNASAQGRVPGDILDSARVVCTELARALGRGQSGAPTRILLATRSIAAYRHYSEALTWFARGGRAGAEEAEACLDRALAEDPGFALAYLEKAEIQQWRRAWGHGDPDPGPSVAAALRLSDSLPPAERLLVRSYDALLLRHAPQDALRDWDALLQFHPVQAQAAGVPALAAAELQRQARWDDVLLVGEAHVGEPSLPEADRARLCSLLAEAHRRHGDHRLAVARAQQALQLWPVREGPRFLGQQVALGRSLVETGQRGQALALFRGAVAAVDADASTLADAGWGLYMAGRPGEALLAAEAALARDPGYGNAHHLRGWLKLAGGEPGPAAQSLETAYRRTPTSFGNPYQGNVSGDLAALYYAGVARLKLGQAAAARALLDELSEHCRQVIAGGPAPAAAWQARSFLARAAARLQAPPIDPGGLEGDDSTFLVQSARLHAVQGRRAEALSELERGLALGHGERRHLQDDPDLESLRGDPAFRRLVTDQLPLDERSPTASAGSAP
jgi:tetratricopeptide (TPR) repeat protein/TolB-like protein